MQLSEEEAPGLAPPRAVSITAIRVTSHSLTNDYESHLSACYILSFHDDASSAEMDRAPRALCLMWLCLVCLGVAVGE